MIRLPISASRRCVRPAELHVNEAPVLFERGSGISPAAIKPPSVGAIRPATETLFAELLSSWTERLAYLLADARRRMNASCAIQTVPFGRSEVDVSQWSQHFFDRRQGSFVAAIGSSRVGF